jgi:hypothetical protein
MASATEIALTTAKAMLDNTLNSELEAGTGDAIINIYDDTGTVPVDCEADNNTNVLIATCVMTATTPFGAATTASPSVATAAAITSDTSAPDTGIAAYFRAYASNSGTDASKIGDPIIQGSAGEAADTTDLTLDDKNIVIGGTVAVTAWTISMPTS